MKKSDEKDVLQVRRCACRTPKTKTKTERNDITTYFVPAYHPSVVGLYQVRTKKLPILLKLGAFVIITPKLFLYIGRLHL